MRYRRLVLVGILASSGLGRSGWGQGGAATVPVNPVSAADRLSRAMSDNCLDGPDAKPWHLKLSYKSTDRKGVASVMGTAEEWWMGPHLHRIVYTMPSGRVEELENGTGFFDSHSGTNIESLDGMALLLAELVHPTPPENQTLGSKVDVQLKDFGTTKLECLSPMQPIEGELHPLFGVFAQYCFDAGKQTLRLSGDSGAELFVRNTIGAFRGVHVGIDTALVAEGGKQTEAHIDALTSAPLTEADFAAGQDLQKRGGTVALPGKMVGDRRTGGLTPLYPVGARYRHVTGSVVLHAIIGRDGKIRRLRVVTAPDSELALASLAAVRTWTYKPFLLHGEATEVDTTVTVNFHIGL